MSSSIRVDRNVPMEMRDGTVLRGDVFRGDDSEKHPAILLRCPYNKLLLGDTDFLSLVDAAFAGYAMVVQDVRGRFASEGEYDGGDNFFAREGPDGYDSVEWVASQPWCDGNVGMAGGSYMALLQWMAAMESPPHLKAIAPWIYGTSTRIESALLDGVINLSVWSFWTAWMGMDIADKLEKQGKDVSQMRQMLNRAILNPEEVYSFLPLKDVPHFQFEDLREIWNVRVLNGIPGPQDAEGSWWPYDKINVPCFHVSGWYDAYTRGTFHNFLSMRKEGGTELAREGQHVLMGPWSHALQLPSFVGDIKFGPFADGRGAQLTERHIAFFNKYLRGMDIELPAIRYFVMGRNLWQDADTWPLPQTQWQKFFLHSKGHANTAGGDGLLSRDKPSSELADIFVYNPHLPVPTTGGRGSPKLDNFVPGPLEQSRIARRNDVLCYTSPELDEDMEVTGPLALHLFASTSVRDTDFTAKLIDVYPDGRAYNVADNIVRARYRKSVFEPELVTPGEVIEYIINMGNSSQLFRKGHRIRIDISSSNFPAFDRNMNTGNPIGEDARGIPAMQTIYHQSEYPSHIALPVIPR
jgi:putative CocE/NonD family hydrolase